MWCDGEGYIYVNVLFFYMYVLYLLIEEVFFVKYQFNGLIEIRKIGVLFRDMV